MNNLEIENELTKIYEWLKKKKRGFYRSGNLAEDSREEGWYEGYKQAILDIMSLVKKEK